MEVLPEILDQVGGRVEAAVDGGFMRGTDIVKALAFGALPFADPPEESG